MIKSLQLILIILSTLIVFIHCSVIVVRKENFNEINPFEMIKDNYGCDAMINSCGKKGKCCDLHDACYKQHGCKATSWFYLWGNYRRCNLDVMACIVRLNPGVSTCCSQYNCGQSRP